MCLGLSRCVCPISTSTTRSPKTRTGQRPVDRPERVTCVLRVTGRTARARSSCGDAAVARLHGEGEVEHGAVVSHGWPMPRPRAAQERRSSAPRGRSRSCSRAACLRLPAAQQVRGLTRSAVPISRSEPGPDLRSRDATRYQGAQRDDRARPRSFSQHGRVRSGIIPPTEL